MNTGNVIVQKGNKRLWVKKEYAQDYVAAGYNIVTNGGSVVQEAVPTDLGALRKAYAEQRSRIVALERELQELKASKSRKKKESE